MNIRHLLAGVIASILVFANAEATLVTPTTAAFAEFDVTSLESNSLAAIALSCIESCTEADDPNNLEYFAGLQINIGTSAGAGDIYSFILDPVFTPDPNDPTLPIYGWTILYSFPIYDIPEAVQSIFLTIFYFDDVFTVDELGIYTHDANQPRDVIRSLASELNLSEVPLPAALPLFIMGIAGIGATASRKRKAA